MNRLDPQSDDRTRKLFAALGTEEPPADFSARLMQQIYAEAARAKIPYQPLLSWKKLMFILLGLLVLLGALAYYAWQTGTLSDPTDPTRSVWLPLLGQATGWLVDSQPLFQHSFYIATSLLVFWGLLLLDKWLAGSDRQRAI
jgi:hypothetical protein